LDILQVSGERARGRGDGALGVIGAHRRQAKKVVGGASNRSAAERSRHSTPRRGDGLVEGFTPRRRAGKLPGAHTEQGGCAIDIALSLTNLLGGFVLVGALSIFLLAGFLFGSPSPRLSRWRAVSAVALTLACGFGAWSASRPADTWGP
jgi:hypothetical protein